MEVSQLYMYHLDNLRRSKKWTVERLCEGICSDRQYRRLLSGEQHLSEFKIEQFCNKLGISMGDFIFSASDREKYEYRKIALLYGALNNNDFEQFKTLNETIHEENIIGTQNQRFYDFCLLRYHYSIKSISSQETAEKLMKLVNYPACLSFEAFDFVDIIALTLLVSIQVKVGELEVLGLLQRILTNADKLYISAESRHIIPHIYATIAHMNMDLRHFEECLQMSLKGIEYCRLHSNNDRLTYLFYFAFISYLRMGLRELAERYAVRCMANAISYGNSYEYQMFHGAIKEEMGMNPFELFQRDYAVSLEDK